MCRFLLARTKESIPPAESLSAFARMCAESRGPGGARQEDGWGIAWQQQDQWNVAKSLVPIWEDEAAFARIPDSRLWVAHARSAGFAEHKGVLSHNQPYVAGNLCFVFNGMVRGVRLPMQVQGEIGAQKFFALLQRSFKTHEPQQALGWLDKTMRTHARQVVGMNIGLVQDERFYVLCDYGEYADYFGLNYHQSDNLTLVCSEKLPGLEWQTMEKGQVLEL